MSYERYPEKPLTKGEAFTEALKVMGRPVLIAYALAVLAVYLGGIRYMVVPGTPERLIRELESTFLLSSFMMCAMMLPVLVLARYGSNRQTPTRSDLVERDLKKLRALIEAYPDQARSMIG